MAHCAQRPEPVQVEWVDALCRQWGAWVRQEDMRASPGCTLGQLYKRRMKELKVWDDSIPQIRDQAGMDDDMLRVDRAIAQLQARQRHIIRMRYWYGWRICDIADKVKRSERTANRWIVEAQQSLSELL